MIQFFPGAADFFSYKEVGGLVSVRASSLQAHRVGPFTLHKDTSPIHGVLFVCERHRRFISCGFFLLCGLHVLKVHLKKIFCILGFH